MTTSSTRWPPPMRPISGRPARRVSKAITSISIVLSRHPQAPPERFGIRSAGPHRSEKSELLARKKDRARRRGEEEEDLGNPWPTCRDGRAARDAARCAAAEPTEPARAPRAAAEPTEPARAPRAEEAEAPEARAEPRAARDIRSAEQSAAPRETRAAGWRIPAARWRT